MKLTVDEGGAQTIVVPQEERIDAAIATLFKDKMREITSSSSKPLLIDLRNVRFLDSSGLGALIAVHKAMPAEQELTVSNLTPNVERVFKLTRMDMVFTITTSDDHQGN